MEFCLSCIPSCVTLPPTMEALHPKIAVLGGGSWGTALAAILAAKGEDVLLWARESEVSDEINHHHFNSIFLPDISLPTSLEASSNLKECLAGRSIILSVLPSHAAREVYSKLKENSLAHDAIFVSCSKGIEISSGKLMSDLFFESLPDHDGDLFTCLSGPTFAREVAQGLPTTAVVAGRNPNVTSKVQQLLRTDYFLTYTHDDVIGVEVGGAVKNVIAIACGMSDGLGFGHNTRAALITRGLYEMIKIGKKLGANPLTFSGLTGVGDLVLTCTGELSRNRTLGYQVGMGQNLQKILKESRMVAEGVNTARAIFELTERLGISAPISTEMYRILHEGKSPRDAVSDLTKRELKEELRSILN